MKKQNLLWIKEPLKGFDRKWVRLEYRKNPEENINFTNVEEV